VRSLAVSCWDCHRRRHRGERVARPPPVRNLPAAPTFKFATASMWSHRGGDDLGAAQSLIALIKRLSWRGCLPACGLEIALKMARPYSGRPAMVEGVVSKRDGPPQTASEKFPLVSLRLSLCEQFCTDAPRRRAHTSYRKQFSIGLAR
jgi:hypothetical protein